MKALGVILLLAAAAAAREYTDEEISSFPKLFHLDDYERCLAAKDGLYCLGTFDLIPEVHPNPTYELLKAYSAESHRHFNRTRIHRGYCVSSRCPQQVLGNVVQRFEHCANQWTRPRTLRASISTLHYCHTHADKHADKPMTTAKQLFLQCICAILVLNIVGTLYDVYTENSPDKNKLLVAFSIPANWRCFTAVEDSADARYKALVPINGIRATAMLATTYVHANIFPYGFYVANPEYLEKLTERVDGVLMFDGTSLMQILLTISCFFTGYNLLMFSKKQALSLSMLPHYIVKRVIRIAPVSLLIIGYAATWWPYIRDGPLVPVSMVAESEICQSKFWIHVFFLNNILRPAEICLTPTWYLPVAMHIYIVACTFTLIMWRHRRAAIKLYSLLFLASCILITVIAYIMGYKSLVYVTTPEEFRTVLRNAPSFTEFYTSSWGALPACFLGLILAHIQFELGERQINLSKYKWFVYLHYCAYPVFLFRALTGFYALEHRTPVFYATYILFDRPMHCILACITMLGLVHVDGPLRKLYSWSGWTRMTRLSMTVMTLHWCVNMAIAARPVAYHLSELDTIVDWIATCVITYTVAVPITILVETPVQKFLRLLLF